MNFNVSTVNLINMLFIASGIGICGLCFLQISASVHLQKVVRNYFQIFFTLIITYISMHLARQLMEGIPGSGIHSALYIVTFIEILSAGFTAHMISMLILSVSKAEKDAKAIAVTLFFLLIGHIIISVIGGSSELVYNFDDANIYHRSSGYLLSNICPFVMLVIDIFLLIKYRSNIERRVKTTFWIYIIAPIAAIVIQSRFYGLQFIIFVSVSAAVYMFSVIVQIQNERYEKQQIDSSRIETELSMASRIQEDMLPNIYPAFPERQEFDIYATMTPAKEVGGDFYDFFMVDEDHLCMVMADVSGKGIPAALFMMSSKIILANNAMLGKSPAKILEDTNAAICANNREEMFVTVWLGILEIS
ncbi:MAG: SpoIIE family protein phosphatase [Lachnospiraceae bacterium]|nr:SpoIIE family protein phosphatase [Lachnospiraceae bacterium]